MIDIHCHILPQVDDGPSSMEESMEMARIAVEEGIDTIINTSHFHTEMDYITGAKLRERIDIFNYELEKKGIYLKVLPGNELYFNEGLLQHIDDAVFHTLAGSRYVLIEFRPDRLPDNMEEVAYEFKLRGYTPIIAHVERYSPVIKNIEMAKELISYGFLLQMNARSLTSHNDPNYTRLCRGMFQRRMIHLVASDAHDSKIRKPSLKEAYKKAKDLVGAGFADEIFISNPNKIISNEPIEPFEVMVEKKGLLGSFMGRLSRK